MRSNSLKSLAGLCAVLTFAASPLCAESWPRFRGANGDGVATGQNIPVTFEDKNTLWKVAIPGEGNSSPVIWDDYLFVQSATDAARTLHCLDSKSGKSLWSQSIPGHKAKIHPKNSLASSSPATDGKCVAASFWDGKNIIVACYDMKGKKQWDWNLGPFMSQHGAGASPIIFEDKVFYVNDQDFYSVMYCFDKATGEIVWRAQREPFRASYAAPFILNRDSVTAELIVTSTTSIRSYNPKDGAVNWSYVWKHLTERPLRATGSSIYVNGMLFACGGDGGGDRHTIAVRLNGLNGKTKPELAWEAKKDFPYVPTMLSKGDYLYYVFDKGAAGCSEIKTGKNLWFNRLPGAYFTASPIMIDGNVYACSEEGDVFVFPAATEFQLLARNQLGELIRATPAVANQRLYIRGDKHLFCIGNP